MCGYYDACLHHIELPPRSDAWKHQFKHLFIMAKVTSLLGGLRGKASNMVFAKTGGEVVMREYNPTIKNPNTEAQVGQRTKFKLASQIAAAMADVIAIPNQGLVSGRNKFQSINARWFFYSGNTAQCSYENIQLTLGNVALPGIYANRHTDGQHYVELVKDAASTIDRVVYAIFIKNSEGMLQLYLSAVVGIPGDNRKFRLSNITLEGECIIYAYGMRDLSTKATAKYDNYNVENGSDVATLVNTRSLSADDYKFTATRGLTLQANADESQTLSDNEVYVFVTAGSGGTVSGGGAYEIGSAATVVATPNANVEQPTTDGHTLVTTYTFDHWQVNGDSSNTVLSRSASYNFTVEAQIDLLAVFTSSTSQIDGEGDHE